MQRQKLGVGASSLSSSSIFSSPSEPALDRKMAVYVLARLSPYLSVCLGFLGFLGSLLQKQRGIPLLAKVDGMDVDAAMSTEWITKLPDGSLIPCGARQRVLWLRFLPSGPPIVCPVVSPQIVDVRFNFSPC